MGTNKDKARQMAQNWWGSSSKEIARCDSCSCTIRAGEGCLCRPSHVGDRTPDLVCEKCFDKYPYYPWSEKQAISQSDYLSKYRQYAASGDRYSLAALLLEEVECDSCGAVVKGTAAALLVCPQCGASWQ